MTRGSACGKAILLGEHAVVYGRPAIAVPVRDVRAWADVQALPAGSGVSFVALDLGTSWRANDDIDDDAARALRLALRLTLERLGVSPESADLSITVSSHLPIARGLGSGTALTTAVVRALAAHYGGYLAPGEQSEVVYQAEIIYHGTPSGVDNTVVAHERPVYFVKGGRLELLGVGRPFGLVIADTGVPSRTRDAVSDVRRQWEAEPTRCERLFDAIAALTEQGRAALNEGVAHRLGELMNENQALLAALGVSSPTLDRLALAACAAGALGAKLTGGGRGGCLIALVEPEARDAVGAAMLQAGAANVYPTMVG